MLPSRLLLDSLVSERAWKTESRERKTNALEEKSPARSSSTKPFSDERGRTPGRQICGLF
jgi:hypothetical protein